MPLSTDRPVGAPSLERLGTGIHGLDRILRGGLIRGSAIVLGGPPGAGKSILAEQLALRHATPERPALLISTRSEPVTRLTAHLSGFTFWREGVLGSAVTPLVLGDLLTTADGVQQAVDTIVRTAVERDAALVVLDSAKAFFDELDRESRRRLCYELVARMAHLDTTLVLVGEYDAAEIADRPEFAVCDTILQLANDAESHVDRRSLRVMKMRGSGFLSGRHSLEITENGVEVYPRLEALVAGMETPVSSGRIGSGVPGLDEHLHGGLPAGDAVLAMGPSGAGKTALALHFVAEGLARGERALYVGLEEGRGDLLAKARSFGLDLEPHVRSGQLEMLPVQITEIDLDKLAFRLGRRLEDSRPDRVVFDSLGELAHGASVQGRNPGYLWALATKARRFGATALFTLEIGAIQGQGATVDAFSHLFHDVLLLRYVEQAERLGRGLAVMKMRDSGHSTGLLDLRIDAQGLSCAGPLRGVQGLLGYTALSSG